MTRIQAVMASKLLGLHVRGRRSANHLARKQVQHHRLVKPPAARSEAVDLSHPSLIGLRRVELPLRHINARGEIASACLLSVVWMHLRFHAERRPCCRINRRTR